MSKTFKLPKENLDSLIAIQAARNENFKKLFNSSEQSDYMSDVFLNINPHSSGGYISNPGIITNLFTPFGAAMASPYKASAPNVIDPKTGIHKYTGEKEYTPFDTVKEYGGEPQDKMGDAYFKNKLSLSDITKTQSTQEEDPTALKVNKDGWVNKKYYQENKDDKEIIGSTQNYLSGKGFDIVPDSTWGNQTYTIMNQDLTNVQLNNYAYTNFTENQFLDQIYKESTGDNSKVSPKGAMGIAQFLPDTFQWAKKKGWIPETAKITDQAASTLAQRRYLDYIYEDRDNVKSAGDNKKERQARSFAAYNMGPTKFDRFWNSLTDEEREKGWKTWYKELDGRDKDHPTETKFYVMWMLDKKTYKENYSTPYINSRGKTTSKWNNVAYGYEGWKNTNPTYRYE